MSQVNTHVLFLDSNGALISRLGEPLAANHQIEIARKTSMLVDQLGEWTPEVLIAHADADSSDDVQGGLTEVTSLYPELPVILVLAESLSEAQRLRLLALPLFAHAEGEISADELEILIRRSRGHSRRQQERLYLRQQHLELDVFEMGGSLGTIHEEIQQAAATDQGVMIYGSPGSGRCEVAKKLHLLSHRAREPFVSFNPAGLSVEDCRVRLFGREGQDGLRRKGSLETADGGTLFIEEFASLPRIVQAELYRMLSEKRLTRVGGIHPLPLDVRPMAAAETSLVEQAKGGDFHSELFGLVHVYSLALPDLAERREDIPSLLRGYLRRFGRQVGKPDLELDPDVESFLASHTWNRSLSELRRTVELAVLRAEGKRLTLADFGVNGLDVELLPITYRSAKKMVEVDFKRRFFTRLLRLAQGKVTRAAEITGVPRPSLSTMLKEVGIEAAAFKPSRAKRKAAAR